MIDLTTSEDLYPHKIGSAHYINNNKIKDNKIEIKDFLHKCYIESARLIYNKPELYWHEFSPLEIKRNQTNL